MDWADHVGQRLRHTKTFWDATSTLLDVWRQHPSADPARHTDDPDRHSAWAELSVETERLLSPQHRPDASNLELAIGDPATIVELIRRHQDSLGVDAIDAVAWGIDVVANETFAPAWVASTRGCSGDHHTLREGELFPVADPAPYPQTTESPELTPRGFSIPEIPAGELPNIRAFSSRGIEVVISFEHAESLEAIAVAPQPIATGHVNASSDEFTFPHQNATDIFPIAARDLAKQESRLTAVVNEAVARGVRILVIPELSGHESVVATLQDRLDTPEVEDLLVIAGSHHVEHTAVRRNIALGLLSDETPLEHEKLFRFTNELRPAIREREGIDTPAPRRITIHQANRFRFAIAICKDFLEPRLSDTLAHVGANVICVPAMSPKTAPYHARALEHVNASQALTIIANGPTAWVKETTSEVPAATSHAEDACIIGQPVARRMLVTVAADAVQAVPSLNVFKVGDQPADIESVIINM